METQKALVENYIKAYNAIEVESMLEFFTEDCLFENVSNSGHSTVCHGKAQLRQLAMQTAQVFAKRQQTVKNWVIGDGKIVAEIDYEATFAMDLPNGIKAGQELKLRGVSVYEIEGDKIRRLADYG